MNDLLLAPLLALHVILLGVVSRRLIGVPVGWPRTLLVALGLALAGNATLTPFARDLGVIDAGGGYAAELNTGVVAALLTLILAWAIAIGVAVLVVLEVLVPTGTLPRPIAVLRDLPARRRRARRYSIVMRIAARHGLAPFLRGGRQPDVRDETPRVARAVRLALTDGGVTFVKLGQMLATRPDLIGPAFAAELSRLHADVPPEPWPVVRGVLEDELGRPIGEVFSEVDETPLAAASVGQVHAARLRDGRAVVVKVQRADACAQVTADLDIVLRLARWLQRTTRWAQAIGLRSLAEGFAASLEEELDYHVEAENMAAVAAGPGGRGGAIHVPALVGTASGRRVLVMERIVGVPLSRADTELAGLDATRRADLARGLLDMVLRQVVQAGVFHADLHGGNVVLQPDGRLALLDFGSVGRLDSATRASLARLLMAIDRDDAVSATDAMLQLLDRPAALDDRTLERELGQLIARYRTGLGTAGAAGMFGELFTLVIRHGFAVPAQLAAVFRALGALEGTLRRIDPGLDFVSTARDTGASMLRERLGPADLRTALEDQLLQVLPLLQRLPRRIDAIARAAQDGDLSLRVRLLADEEDRSFIPALVQQGTLAVIAAATAVVAVLFVTAPDGPVLASDISLFPVLGATFLLISFVLAARVLALAFRHAANDGADTTGRRSL